MANEKKITMTQEGYDELVKELKWREGEERERIKSDIVTARGFGDLSENAEYDEARNEQAKTEARIKELEELIENAVIVNENEIDTSVVSLGSVVRVRDESDGEEIEYSLVGSNEANPLLGKISDQSPVGKRLMGTREGAVLHIEAPVGTITLTVLSVSRSK